jgi:hypothetical protein
LPRTLDSNRLVAGLSFGAALIHASVILVHFREYWLFGLFFALVTPLQVVWAVLVAGGIDDWRLLVGGAVANLLIAAVWIVSRTSGLPFGPHPWEPEAVGFKDLLATVDELALGALVLLPLRRAVAPAWVLVAASLVAAFLPGGH